MSYQFDDPYDPHATVAHHCEVFRFEQPLADYAGLPEVLVKLTCSFLGYLPPPQIPGMLGVHPFRKESKEDIFLNMQEKENLPKIKLKYLPDFDNEFKRIPMETPSKDILMYMMGECPFQISEDSAEEAVEDAVDEYIKQFNEHGGKPGWSVEVPWLIGSINQVEIYGEPHFMCSRPNGDSPKYGAAVYIFRKNSSEPIVVYDERYRNHASFSNHRAYRWDSTTAAERAMFILMMSLVE